MVGGEFPCAGVSEHSLHRRKVQHTFRAPPETSCAVRSATALARSARSGSWPRAAHLTGPSDDEGRPRGAAFVLSKAVPVGQRLENWKLRRALRRPYFLRSTTRLSRVRNPAAFSAPRRRRIVELQRLRDAVLDRAGLAREAAAGDRRHHVELARDAGDLERLAQDHLQHRPGEVGRRWSLPFTVTLPEPGLIQTRATASLRLPVA